MLPGACGKNQSLCAIAFTIAKKVEMLFAHLKRILRLVRLRLRGPSGAKFEFTPRGYRTKPAAARQAGPTAAAGYKLVALRFT